MESVDLLYDIIKARDKLRKNKGLFVEEGIKNIMGFYKAPLKVHDRLMKEGKLKKDKCGK